MITSILTLYFLGLTLLILSDFLGLSLFRFRTIPVFAGVFVGYLTMISTYAIFKSNFNSIGFFVLFWVLGYLFVIGKTKEIAKINIQDYFNRLLIVSILWTVIFLLKVSFFWNKEYQCPNLLFYDYEYYMKVAEGFNLTGNENTFGLKNVLFPFLNFAQPYRTNDFWLVSLGLDLTKIDTIFIWELFYSTIIICICSLSLFTLLKTKFKFFFSLVLSVLLLFAFSGNWYYTLINLLYPHNSGSYDPVGIVAYTKLTFVFSIMFQFFFKLEIGKKIEAVYLLILIPLLIQSTISIFIVVFFTMFFYFFEERKAGKYNSKKYLSFVGFFIFIILGLILFYHINHNKEEFYVGYNISDIINNDSFFDFVTQFFKKFILLFISYFWISFLLVFILLFITKSMDKILRMELVMFLFCFYFSSILVSANYNKIGSAYQFTTNVFGPFVLSLIIYLLIQTPINSVLGKLKLTFLVLVSIIGMKSIVGGNNVFHSVDRIHFYDKKFINEVKTILPKLNYPFGIIYEGKEQNNFAEDFPQNNTTFLKLFGRNHDVFNIEADSLKNDFSNKANQKKNVSISRNALNIWIRNQERINKANNKNQRKLGGKDFYNTFPFSFCISKKTKDSLPDFIKSDVVSVIRDKSSKIYFYTLDRK